MVWTCKENCYFFEAILKDLQTYSSQTTVVAKNLFVDVVVTCPVKHKYVVAAAQTLGFSCNDCAEVVKTKTLEARVYEDDALILPVFEPSAGFSRAIVLV